MKYHIDEILNEHEYRCDTETGDIEVDEQYVNHIYTEGDYVSISFPEKEPDSSIPSTYKIIKKKTLYYMEYIGEGNV